jgi:hypothetical protein
LHLKTRHRRAWPARFAWPGRPSCRATKPFWHRHEVILKPTISKKAACTSAGVDFWMSSMVEAITSLLGLFSVAIFLAHAIEAYQAHN